MTSSTLARPPSSAGSSSGSRPSVPARAGLGLTPKGPDGSIVIIALPAFFRGINLDPLAPGSVTYLLWMIMGYRLVQAVLVVTLGRLGDMFGRVRIYNAGFAVFTAASVLLSFAATDEVPPPAAGKPPHAAAPHAGSQPSSGTR